MSFPAIRRIVVTASSANTRSQTSASASEHSRVRMHSCFRFQPIVIENVNLYLAVALHSTLLQFIDVFVASWLRQMVWLVGVCHFLQSNARTHRASNILHCVTDVIGFFTSYICVAHSSLTSRDSLLVSSPTHTPDKYTHQC